MFQHKEIKSAKEGECLKTWLPIILAFTWRLLGGKKKGFPNLKSAVIVYISFSIKYLKMASVIYLCASSHISNIGLREGREAVNIRAIMSPPLHSLWLIGSYKGGNMKTFINVCSNLTNICQVEHFSSDGYLAGSQRKRRFSQHGEIISSQVGQGLSAQLFPLWVLNTLFKSSIDW